MKRRPADIFVAIHAYRLSVARSGVTKAEDAARAAGLDPDNLPESDPSKMNFGGDSKKAWKDIWGCGQGIGAVTAVVSTAERVAQLKREYQAARARLAL